MIEERAPVWSALSELFLDTELEDADLDRIAAVLAASPYSEDKLEEILRYEVTPVLKSNLRRGAGAWTGFDSDWLCEKITPRIEKKPLFRWPISRLVRVPWRRIRSGVLERRKGGHTSTQQTCD
jgi:hypothetical protein